MAIEVGQEYSNGQFNDFKRCPKCGNVYFVNATGSQRINIQCPYCDTVRAR